MTEIRRLGPGDGELPVGMVTGVETTHPDKGTEMFLYELSVDVGPHRRRQPGCGPRLHRGRWNIGAVDPPDRLDLPGMKRLSAFVSGG